MLHDSVYHAFPPVEGLLLQTTQLNAKGLFVTSPLLVAATGLQLAHGAGIGHSMNHPRRRNGVRKRALSETSFEDHTVVGDLVPGFQTGAVPAMTSELVLALVNGDLDALDGRGGHIWVPHAHLQLSPVQARECQTHGIGVQYGIDVGDLQT